MPLDVGRVTHLLEQMHRSEDDAGSPIAAGQHLVTDGARGFTWEPAGASIGDYFNVMDYGAVGDNSTDDTVAIQDTIDACFAAGGGTVYFPPGTYVVGGALQDTGAFNGQILFPDVDLADPQLTIRVLGPLRPPLAIHGDEPDPGGYATIRSTLTGATGTAAVFSGGNGPYTVYQNNLQVIWQNLILIVPTNPTLTGLNLDACQGGIVRDNWFADFGGWYSGTNGQPTNTNSYGYKLPGKRNSWYTVAEGNGVVGFYTGFLCGELVVSRGGLGAAFCIVGMELPEVEHLSAIQEFGVTAVTYPIRVTGLHPFVITAMDMQHDASPAWAVTVYDLDDPSDLGLGEIAWYSGHVVSDHTFTKNGGANVWTYEIGTMPSALDDTHSHTTATISGIHGKLLLESGHAVPFVFDEILQDSDGTDFLYASA